MADPDVWEEAARARVAVPVNDPRNVVECLYAVSYWKRARNSTNQRTCVVLHEQEEDRRVSCPGIVRFVI